MFVAGLVATGCASSEKAPTDTASRHYRVTSAPSGYEPCGAFDEAMIAADGGAAIDTGEPDAVIWSDLSRADPWRGRLAVLTDRRGVESRFYANDGSHPTTVQGHPGNIGPFNAFQGVTVTEWGHSVTWSVSATRVAEVSLRGGTETQTRRLAERAIVTAGGIRLPDGALGSQTGVLFTSEPRTVPKQILWLNYRRGELAADDGDQLFLTVTSERTNEFELASLFAVTAEPTTVGGRPGIATADWSRTKGPFAVTWKIAPGQTATLRSFKRSAAEVHAAAESVQPISDGDWKTLVEQSADCQQSRARDLPKGVGTAP